MPHFLDYVSAYQYDTDKPNKNNKIKITATSVVAIMTDSKFFHLIKGNRTTT